jgi:heat shock protein HspQ
MLTEGYAEKYVKKLIGRTEIEDRLKRLDRLTQEEARMAAAQNLKVTHAVDERVKGVAGTVVAIDNRVAGVDDRVRQTASDVDEMKRLPFRTLLLLTTEPHTSFQGTYCRRAFTIGSPHRTLRRTTTSHMVLITRKQRPGFFKATSFRTGSQQGPFFGSTENVCSVLFLT